MFLPLAKATKFIHSAISTRQNRLDHRRIVS